MAFYQLLPTSAEPIDCEIWPEKTNLFMRHLLETSGVHVRWVESETASGPESQINEDERPQAEG